MKIATQKITNENKKSNIVLPQPTREQRLKRKKIKISNELSTGQIKRLDRKEFKQALNGTFKEITLYNNDFTLEYMMMLILMNGILKYFMSLIKI